MFYETYELCTVGMDYSSEKLIARPRLQKNFRLFLLPKLKDFVEGADALSFEMSKNNLKNDEI